eukprot:TRINITY_DN3663_c0_g3_i4.p1 TRINITY_DN3663_c0_g3~~TRINITY_DN3663_c0_g3_i4.p1  ORF type:complete len:309 (+),score=52.37 TRINITY_DN3663_c0_g3_i4:3-929(+)
MEKALNKHLTTSSIKTEQNPYMNIKLFSDEFYKKLEMFDAGGTQISFLEESEASRGLDSFNNFLNESRGGDSMRKTRVQLPAIQKSSPKAKSPVLRAQSNVSRSMNDPARITGLKFFLGHLNNVEDPKASLVISKSSINLNKLQDRIGNIDSLRRRKMVKDAKKEREDLEIIMCPYYGDGKSDKQRLIQYLNKDNNSNFFVTESSQYSRVLPRNTTNLKIAVTRAEIEEQKNFRSNLMEGLKDEHLPESDANQFQDENGNPRIPLHLTAVSSEPVVTLDPKRASVRFQQTTEYLFCSYVQLTYMFLSS